jgi:hypothetical protein
MAMAEQLKAVRLGQLDPNLSFIAIVHAAPAGSIRS